MDGGSKNILELHDNLAKVPRKKFCTSWHSLERRGRNWLEAILTKILVDFGKAFARGSCSRFELDARQVAPRTVISMPQFFFAMSDVSVSSAA